MPRIPLRLPPPGDCQIADQIRIRRHPRDLISLDGVLLNHPAIASGWNSLLGPIRTENSLPADIRELLILRVAALNSAAYEWSHHEPIARSAGMSTLQLNRVRDIIKPIETGLTSQTLTPQQSIALCFADAVTRTLDVPDQLITDFKHTLGGLDPHRALLDATLTVASYNMVSRLLITLNVADDRLEPVPLPGLMTSHHQLSMPDGTQLAICTHAAPDDLNRPWLVFVNSLLSSMAMWNLVLPSLGARFNLLTFDQRGHGQSTVPSTPCTINGLADDIIEIIHQLKLDHSNLHALIGVSQGGATALSLASTHPTLFNRYVICDTQPASPPTNRQAWEARLGLRDTPQGATALAKATVSRWFPSASALHLPDNRVGHLVRSMIEETSLQGFRAGAEALCDYRIEEGPLKAQKILLLVGQDDGGLPDVMEGLSQRIGAQFVKVEGAGHLPMLDQPARFLSLVEEFL